jgi:acid phosphatase (class A)
MADIETVLQVQTWRSPEQVAWAQLTDSDTLFNFSSVIGPWFTASNLPTCHGTFRKVAADIYAVCESAKKRYSRPRPPQADASVKPCVNVPHNTSYPSGHSAQAFVSAHILSELFPEHRKDLLARAHKVAWGRIIAGVHFPTDDVAGRILAETAFTMMMKNPAFLKALEQCRQELSPFRMKKAG